ncbi:tyrosine-type recombinase/integrase [Rhizobium leguminosarum]|uniref:tyrosine-type recombinase/integrase n=1 Tax=Rhizobium leguminosarum TaxID=384 RepID=UPI0032B23646
MRNVVHELSKARSGTKASEKRAKAKLRIGVDIPTNEETRKILEAATGHRPLIITMIFTGIRSSEARGLRWEDVKLKKGQLHVRQRADRYGKVGMPKSEAGQRTVPLPPIVVNTLKERKLSCPANELGLVFPNQAGNIEFHNNMPHRVCGRQSWRRDCLSPRTRRTKMGRRSWLRNTRASMPFATGTHRGASTARPTAA